MTIHPQNPRVSVLLPTYNAAATVARAIDSILAQTAGDLELIVVDDGSVDGTPARVVERFGHDPRVRSLPQPCNRGPAHARNVGLAAARGEWIGLVDADDAWRPDRVARLLSRAAGLDAVFDNLVERDPVTGVETGALFPVFRPGPLTVEALLAPTAAGSRHDFGYLKPLLRCEFLRANAIVYDERLRTSEDLVLYLRVLLAGARTALVDEPLYVYTTAVSRATGGTSAFTNTVPRDDDVRAVLTEVLEQVSGPKDGAAARAIAGRIDFLRRIRPISEFDHARRRRDYRRATMLLARHADVRRELIARLRRRFSRF